MAREPDRNTLYNLPEEDIQRRGSIGDIQLRMNRRERYRISTLTCIRRQLGLLALGAAVVACHGAQGDDGELTPASAAADAMASSWADAGPAGPAYADLVVAAPGATGSGFGDADNAVNGVRGGGRYAGSLDVYSLGVEPGVDNYMTLAWSDRVVGNGPGIDFVVFENPFTVSGTSSNFMEQVVVQVSRDGEQWVDIPHDYIHADETVYSADPAMWVGFAGVRPVLYHEENNLVDPFDPAVAGGDPFDLDTLPADGGLAEDIRMNGFYFIRLVTAPSQINSDTDLPYPRPGLSTGADIDGVYARYLAPASK